MKNQDSTRRQFCSAGMALLFGLPAILSACSPIVWIGGTGHWGDASKWSKGRVPTVNDIVFIRGGTIVLPVDGISQGRDFANCDIRGVHFIATYT